MQVIHVNALKPHPKNEYFFDSITGSKWDDFLDSVRTSGVIEPIVITGDLTIVSGHQRVRACKELGIEKVVAEVHIYDDADAVLKDLIETNVRQRGVIDNTVKMGRIVKELERLYHIKDLPKNEMAAMRGKIRSFTGRSTEYMYRAKRVSRLDPEIQSAVQRGQVPLCAAANTLSKLTEEQQIEFALAIPAMEKWTQQQVETYAGLLKEKDERLNELQHNHDKLASRLDDIANEDKQQDKILELQQISRTAYETAEALRKTIKEKDKEIKQLKNNRIQSGIVMSTEGLGAVIQRFMDELEAFEPLFRKPCAISTRSQYYKWLMEAAEAAEHTAVRWCDRDNSSAIESVK